MTPLLFNLKTTAVEREKAVQAIDVHREFNNCVVTLWVMSQFLNFLGASRCCADFRDPTAVFRFKVQNPDDDTLSILDYLRVKEADKKCVKFYLLVNMEEPLTCNSPNHGVGYFCVSETKPSYYSLLDRDTVFLLLSL